MTLSRTFEPQAKLLQQLLGNAVKTGDSGGNTLFYGVPGTGKTELAKAVFSSLGFTGYNVRTTGEDGEPLRREGCLGGYQMA